MILGQLSKSFAVNTIATVATNATASVGPFDVGGYEQLIFRAIHPAATATNASAKWAALEVLLGDTTDLTSATAVSGLSGTTGTASTSQFALGVWNNTSVSSVTRLSVSGNRHKYAFIKYQPPAGASYTAPAFVVDAFNGGQAANSATEANVAAWASAADAL
jgi:hypothetical protein